MTSDGRGGWIHTEGFDQVSGKKWGQSLPPGVGAPTSMIFKGENKPLDMDLVPRTQIVIKKRSSFPDMWWGENGLLTISLALKDIIEAHDPGRHYIWPMTLLTKRHVEYEGAHFGFVPGVHASVLDEENSDVRKEEERFVEATRMSRARRVPRKVRLWTYEKAAVRKADLPDAHLWWDASFDKPYLFASDSLQDAIKAAGLKTIRMVKVKEV
jgi:hypothetical protein